MWVKMITDQIKAGGIYLRGQNLDLPESIIEKFDEGSYEPTCAPWDKNVPPEQLRLRTAEASYKTIKARVDQFEKQIESTKVDLSGFEYQYGQAVKDLDKATKELERAKKTIEEASEAKAAEEEAARKAAADAKSAGEPVLPEPPKSVDIGEAQTSEEEKIDGPEKTKTQKSKGGPSKKH